MNELLYLVGVVLDTLIVVLVVSTVLMLIGITVRRP